VSVSSSQELRETTMQWVTADEAEANRRGGNAGLWLYFAGASVAAKSPRTILEFPARDNDAIRSDARRRLGAR
jgi:hypothetical protein